MSGHVITIAELDANPWAACGPTALAALLGKPLADVRAGFPTQTEKDRWVNQHQMVAAVRALARVHDIHDRNLPAWPRHGVVLIQFEGTWSRLPWSHPAQLQHTHWIAVKQTEQHGPFVFDINSLGGMVSREGPGWGPRSVWAACIVPQIVESYGTVARGPDKDKPRATGRWCVRAGIEVVL